MGKNEYKITSNRVGAREIVTVGASLSIKRFLSASVRTACVGTTKTEVLTFSDRVSVI